MVTGWLLRVCGRARPVGIQVGVDGGRWPVREKKTSSSEGGRTSMLSTRMPAASSARTTMVARPAELSTAASSWRPSSLTWTRPSTRSCNAPIALLVGHSQRDDEPGAFAGFLELARRALGDDAPVIDDDDLVGQRVGLFEVLGGQQQGDAFAHQLPDDVPHAQAAGGVEPGRRLVQEQHGRPGHKAGRQVEAAAHAARVALQDPIGGERQLEAVQQLRRPSPRGGASHAAQLADQRQVLAPGQHPVEGGVLRRHADVAAYFAGLGA